VLLTAVEFLFGVYLNDFLGVSNIAFFFGELPILSEDLHLFLLSHSFDSPPPVIWRNLFQFYSNFTLI